MLDGKFLSWLLEKLTVGTKSSIRHFHTYEGEAKTFAQKISYVINM